MSATESHARSPEGAFSIGLIGSGGRMADAIATVARDRAIPIAGQVSRSSGNLDETIATADIAIDFSAPEALTAILAAAIRHHTPVLIGTTGLAPHHHQAIDQAARTIPVLQAANTSLGVALLGALVARAARTLGPEWDIELVEMHHRAKKDAPSGTALWLADRARAGRKAADHDSVFSYGHPDKRVPGTIGLAALRGGSVIGDHLVVFAGDGERIELGHRADDRSLFARGALQAAQWLIGRPPGRYAMADVIGLSA